MGTVQGVMDMGPIGAIQNVGVIPDVPGLGLGRALVRRALGVPPGRTAAGLSGGHRREQRRRPALSQRRLSAGQDAVQGGRWVNRGAAVTDRRAMGCQMRTIGDRCSRASTSRLRDSSADTLMDRTRVHAAGTAMISRYT